MNHNELRADLKALASAVLTYIVGPRETSGRSYERLTDAINLSNVQIVLGLKEEKRVEVRTEVPRELMEKLAELEHDQWAHWTKYMLDNLGSVNIYRWRRQIDTPYADLTEAEKEADRVWARKMIEEVLNHDVG